MYPTSGLEKNLDFLCEAITYSVKEKIGVVMGPVIIDSYASATFPNWF